MARRRRAAEGHGSRTRADRDVTADPIAAYERLDVRIWIEPQADKTRNAEELLAWARVHAPEYVLSDEDVFHERRNGGTDWKNPATPHRERTP